MRLVISRWPSLQENCRSAGAVMGFAFPGPPETSLNRPLLAVFSSSALSRTSAKGQPPTCCEASGWTTSKTRWGLLSSIYFESCQLLTTAPRLEISTRYKSFCTTMDCSSLADFGVTATGAVDLPEVIVEIGRASCRERV